MINNGGSFIRGKPFVIASRTKTLRALARLRGFVGRFRQRLSSTTDRAQSARSGSEMTPSYTIATEMLRFSSKREYDDFFSSRSRLFESRWLWGQNLHPSLVRSGGFDGWCGACGCPARFSFESRQDGAIDLREEMVCEHCDLNARHRVSLGLLGELRPDTQATRIYATEQASPAFRWLHRHYPELVGSEYFTDDQELRLKNYLHELLGNDARLRFEDATNLSFEDESFEALVSSDILEHIPDFQTALHNFYRVLVPGGDLVLTVPFRDANQESLLRAEIDASGEIRHLVEPEYHGDPVSPDGVLAFHSFGWDLLDALRECGFESAQWCLPWQPSQAIFSGLWILHARK